jgi:hypothetical protein
VCTTGDTAHIYTIFKFLATRASTWCIDILHCCNDPCLKTRIIAAVKNLLKYIFIALYSLARNEMWAKKPSVTERLKGNTWDAAPETYFVLIDKPNHAIVEYISLQYTT